VIDGVLQQDTLRVDYAFGDVAKGSEILRRLAQPQAGQTAARSRAGTVGVVVALTLPW
jgi:hypothetical protein